ncbi:MAG: hypothetical protein JWP51_4209 [Bradyrhizobium sp.]|jgi:hypothetical protein|nr:hypothetical protein [Bradyrhizobium sp.]
MYSESQFNVLEVVCRQRAAAARKEMEYWLNEAEEWARLSMIAPTRPTRHAGAPDALASREVDTPPFD